MNSFVVKVSNLVKTFDTKKIIKNISFNVNENSVTGVLGKNGAGKTTLLGMLMGLISPSSGKIEILGKNLFFKKNEILKEINFQSPYIDLPKKELKKHSPKLIYFKKDSNQIDQIKSSIPTQKNNVVSI